MVLFGNACHKLATIPAITGLEKEVPFAVTIFPEESDKTTDCPCAITSGFTLPSKEGPIELKLVTVFEAFTAPTVSTEIPSAGTAILGFAVAPSFPAEATTIIPREKAISAPRVIKAVLPSISL